MSRHGTAFPFAPVAYGLVFGGVVATLLTPLMVQVFSLPVTAILSTVLILLGGFLPLLYFAYISP